ncbi:SDR family NAD(P)-dependent oxidoreductase [Maricurvus nonylphenolicus]|uniref:SDR family NAD(P)-dependent oxidoreductase n=1 Tax=Maricurvus nonylphenolicus TaxID=1008307 RepID=UPI0036F26F75
MNITNKTIIVTGGASGIGRELTIEAMRRGASVAIADLNIEGVLATKELAEAVATAGATCSAHQLDVSNLEQWQSFRDAVLTEYGHIDGIINNAGITFAGTAEATDYRQYEKVMSINFMGMVYGSKELLPHLHQRPEAFIANVSSVCGLFAMKKQSAYCASKFAIRGFTESLAQELIGSPILVSSIHPGHIGTDIVINARNSGNMAGDLPSEAEQEAIAKYFKDYGLSPAKAAEIILDGLKNNQRKILVGKDAIRGDRLSRLMPQTYANKINKLVP